MRRVHPLARIQHARAVPLMASLAALFMLQPAEGERRRGKGRRSRKPMDMDARPKDAGRMWCGIKKCRMVTVGQTHAETARRGRRFPMTRLATATVEEGS